MLRKTLQETVQCSQIVLFLVSPFLSVPLIDPSSPNQVGKSSKATQKVKRKKKESWRKRKTRGDLIIHFCPNRKFLNWQFLFRSLRIGNEDIYCLLLSEMWVKWALSRLSSAKKKTKIHSVFIWSFDRKGKCSTIYPLPFSPTPQKQRQKTMKRRKASLYFDLVESKENKKKSFDHNLIEKKAFVDFFELKCFCGRLRVFFLGDLKG